MREKSIKMSRKALPQILVVDDNQNLTLALIIGLKRVGFGVEAAADGKKALVQLENGCFDVVLTDVEMPILSGVDLAQLIEQRFPKTHLIVMSAYEQPSSLHRFPFLAKPFELEALIGLLPPQMSTNHHYPSKRGNYVR